MLRIYPKSFNKRSIDSLEVLARNDSIDNKYLFYKILFYHETSVKCHEINFLKSTLYSLLKNLVTSKVGIADANADQMRFIVSLLMGYYDKIMILGKIRPWIWQE